MSRLYRAPARPIGTGESIQAKLNSAPIRSGALDRGSSSDDPDLRTLACVPSNVVLPEWLDADRMNVALVGGIASLAVAAFVALRLIRKLMLAVLVAIVLAGAAALLAVQWTGLRDCRETCTCNVFGQSVEVPDNPLCGPGRIEPGGIDVNIDLRSSGSTG